MLNKLNELRKGKEEGFTLIELLVVILIIGVLSAIALPIFLNQQKEATKASVKSDVRNTVTNVATYLVKVPNATAAQLATTAANTPPQTGSTDNYDVVHSGANAITVSSTGGYTAYKVTGTETGLGTWGYEFDSESGKYSEVTV